MDVKNLIMAVIALSLGAVMIGGALLPAVGGVLEDETTFDNTTNILGYIDEFNKDERYELIHNVATGTTTVNGENVNLFEGTIILDVGAWNMRYGNTSSGPYFQITGDNAQGTFNVTNNITIVAYDGNLEVSADDTQNYTYEYDYLYALASSGKYVMKNIGSEVYMRGDSKILAMGLTTIDGNYRNLFYIHGNIKNGVVVENLTQTYTGSIENIQVNSTSVSGYNDLYKLTSITFDVVTTESTTSCTYDYFVVPAEVTAYIEGSGLTAPISALFNALPLIAIAGLVMAGVYIFISRK